MWGGTFSLEMAYFSVNSVVCFNRNVRLFSARTTTVTVYCWPPTSPLTGEGSGDGAVTPPQKILGLFHLKWLILVQSRLYFNRNFRQLTARTTTVTCVLYCWRLRWVRSNQSNPPRYGPG